MKHDPKCAEISASKRQGNIYVKMPIAKARLLLVLLEILHNLAQQPDRKEILSLLFFLKELIARNRRSFLVYKLTPDRVTKDIALLQRTHKLDASGLVKELFQVLEAGVQGSPEVDWISRVGGPPPDKEKATHTPTAEFSSEEFF